jgi:16S rRNA (cytosine1402-N4)-methyltransferase
MVKQFLREASGEKSAPTSRHLPEVPRGEPATFTAVSRAVRPSEAEVARNPRARSATLRFATRTDAPPRRRLAA